MCGTVNLVTQAKLPRPAAPMILPAHSPANAALFPLFFLSCWLHRLSGHSKDPIHRSPSLVTTKQPLAATSPPHFDGGGQPI